MTKHEDGRYTGTCGEVYWQSWRPDGDAGGVVVIAHGYAEHSGRYGHVGERLATDGYAVYALDHAGHGRSAGQRGNIDRMSGVCTDLDQLITLAAEQQAGVPVFLLGHSWGGLIALDYVTSHNVDRLRGLVLSGPAVISTVGSKLERAAAKVLSAVVPKLGVVAALDSGVISRDKAVVSAYDNDPLNYRGKLPARFGAEGLAAMGRVSAMLPAVRLPVLVMHGSEDQLAAPEGSKLVADRVSSDDVTLKIYDGLFHEIFNEPEQDVVLDELVEWLKART